MGRQIASLSNFDCGFTDHSLPFGFLVLEIIRLCMRDAERLMQFFGHSKELGKKLLGLMFDLPLPKHPSRISCSVVNIATSFSCQCLNLRT